MLRKCWERGIRLKEHVRCIRFIVWRARKVCSHGYLPSPSIATPIFMDKASGMWRNAVWERGLGVRVYGKTANVVVYKVMLSKKEPGGCFSSIPTEYLFSFAGDLFILELSQ
jgi:hypothetical protein